MRNFKEDLEKVATIANWDDVETLRFPIFYTKEIENILIEDLELSQRAYTVLRTNRVRCLGELIRRWDEIKDFRSCGIITRREIKQKFLQKWYQMLSNEDVDRFWEGVIRENYVEPETKTEVKVA